MKVTSGGGWNTRQRRIETGDERARAQYGARLASKILSILQYLGSKILKKYTYHQT